MNVNTISNLDSIIADLQKQIDDLKNSKKLVILPSYTTAERDALRPLKGRLIWNEDTNSVEIFDPINESWTAAN